MKNLSLILNAVLLIAVVVLFFLHFSGKKTATSPNDSTAAAFTGDLKIAFINSDSVLEQYDFLKANRAVIEEKNKKIEQEYRKDSKPMPVDTTEVAQAVARGAASRLCENWVRPIYFCRP